MKEKLRQFYALRSKKTAQTRLKDMIEIAILSDDAAMVHPVGPDPTGKPHHNREVQHRS